MLVNGNAQTTVSIYNRGLAYGDGAFETIRLERGRPLFLAQHLERLARACRTLGIPECTDALQDDLQLLGTALTDHGIVKIIVTRGEGGRGYRGRTDAATQRIITLHPLPDYSQHQPEQGITAFISSVRLAIQPALAGVKHLNRLEQVLASSLWPADDSIFEGLMLDGSGQPIEGTRSNLFIARENTLLTPELKECGVAGILRGELLRKMPGAEVRILTLQDVLAADEMFFCNSVAGIWPVTRIAAAHSAGLLKHDIHFDHGPLTTRARQVFAESLATV